MLILSACCSRSGLDLSNIVDLILCIETSNDICSVSISGSDHNIVACTSYRIVNRHSDIIVEEIHHMFDVVRVRMDQLSAVCVSCGPGSYTGIRIGVAVALGICQALDIKLMTVNLLDYIADYVLHTMNVHCLCCPMIGMRNGNIYYTIRDAGENVLCDTTLGKITDAKLRDFINNNEIVIINCGRVEFTDDILKLPNVLVMYSMGVVATAMVKKAWQMFESNSFTDMTNINIGYADICAGI